MTSITETEALRRVTSYCSSAERCKSEVNDKLQRWGLPYDSINRILEHLEKEKFIDEERFCRAFVRDKYRIDKWGKVKIAQALQLKKIPWNAYIDVLNSIDTDEYLSILQSLLETKRKSIRAKSPYELDGKLIRFAMSRGFEMDDIRRCLPSSDEKEYGD